MASAGTTEHKCANCSWIMGADAKGVCKWCEWRIDAVNDKSRSHGIKVESAWELGNPKAAEDKGYDAQCHWLHGEALLRRASARQKAGVDSWVKGQAAAVRLPTKRRAAPSDHNSADEGAHAMRASDAETIGAMKGGQSSPVKSLNKAKRALRYQEAHLKRPDATEHDKNTRDWLQSEVDRWQTIVDAAKSLEDQLTDANKAMDELNDKEAATEMEENSLQAQMKEVRDRKLVINEQQYDLGERMTILRQKIAAEKASSEALRSNKATSSYSNLDSLEELGIKLRGLDCHKLRTIVELINKISNEKAAAQDGAPTKQYSAEQVKAFDMAVDSPAHGATMVDDYGGKQQQPVNQSGLAPPLPSASSTGSEMRGSGFQVGGARKDVPSPETPWSPSTAEMAAPGVPVGHSLEMLTGSRHRVACSLGVLYTSWLSDEIIDKLNYVSGEELMNVQSHINKMHSENATRPHEDYMNELIFVINRTLEQQVEVPISATDRPVPMSPPKKSQSAPGSPLRGAYASPTKGTGIHQLSPSKTLLDRAKCPLKTSQGLAVFSRKDRAGAKDLTPSDDDARIQQRDRPSMAAYTAEKATEHRLTTANSDRKALREQLRDQARLSAVVEDKGVSEEQAIANVQNAQAEAIAGTSQDIARDKTLTAQAADTQGFPLFLPNGNPLSVHLLSIFVENQDRSKIMYGSELLIPPAIFDAIVAYYKDHVNDVAKVQVFQQEPCDGSSQERQASEALVDEPKCDPLDEKSYNSVEKNDRPATDLEGRLLGNNLGRLLDDAELGEILRYKEDTIGATLRMEDGSAVEQDMITKMVIAFQCVSTGESIPDVASHTAFRVAQEGEEPPGTGQGGHRGPGSSQPRASEQ